LSSRAQIEPPFAPTTSWGARELNYGLTDVTRALDGALQPAGWTAAAAQVRRANGARIGAASNKRKEGETSPPRLEASGSFLGGGEAKGREITGGGFGRRSGLLLSVCEEWAWRWCGRSRARGGLL
jgi:hypothetical protein